MKFNFGWIILYLILILPEILIFMKQILILILKNSTFEYFNVYYLLLERKLISIDKAYFQ